MRRWTELTGVERVALYTRQSLYFVLWAFSGSMLLGAAAKLDDSGEAVLLGAGGLAVTALGFAGALAVLHRRPLRGPVAATLAGGAALCAAVAVTSTADAATTAATITVASLALSVGLLPDNRIAYALIAGSGLLFALVGDQALDLFAGVVAASAFLFTGRVSMWVLGVVTELDTARQAQAQLAVVEERLRFSRDVHDVLGRRLSTIAVQAELASTLAERGDDRAAAQMLEVRAVAHEALREARELARGYRATDFPTELEGARSLLRSAGIEVRLDVDDMPRAWQEPAAWVVRESATNVLRHSDATWVRIAYGDGRLTVTNDGARGGAPGAAADGAGLRGLRERLTPLGATLDAGPDGDDSWSVVARLPGTGPLTATTTTVREGRQT